MPRGVYNIVVAKRWTPQQHTTKEIKTMKYHNHEIKKTPTDLGEEEAKNNFTYEIYKDGEYIQTALTLSTAKTYIDSGYNDTYL
jgi:hypothetical protein